MSRLSRPLYVAYGALLAWLAYSAVISARNGATWACAAFLIGSGLAVTAAIREGDLEDALRREAIRTERHTRTNQTAEAALNEACCERWWTSLATDHDPNCPNQQRSAA